MRRGFKCKKEVLEVLKQGYDDIVMSRFQGNLLEALKNFDSLAENSLRNILRRYYPNQRSQDQAWKTCKGSLYEYAVFKYIQNIVKNDKMLRDKITVMIGEEALILHKDQIAIRNWCDIFPDVDILIIKKKTNSVIAILSCKTSLRERLTETAFWKRELEKRRNMTEIKLVFVTTDKDNELRTETNRYILLHVVDYTFITDPEKYDRLIGTYEKKYGNRDDFHELLKRIKFIDEIEEFIHYLLNRRNNQVY
ncbi:MAG: BsaWI family type II restriction enzyme [Candidatus Desulfofervidus auxilii]|nr:BsaWI family type II restriction enzyme [Candidatus Desulfofervidus auxilii]